LKGIDRPGAAVIQFLTASRGLGSTEKLGCLRNATKIRRGMLRCSKPEQPRREEEKGGPARGRGGVCGAGKFQPRDR